MQRPSKMIRRGIVLLELLILVAAFAAVRYAASLPDHYQIIYHDPYTRTGGIDLFQPDTGKTIRLMDTMQDTVPACAIELRVDDTTAAFSQEKFWQMSVDTLDDPILLEFWSGDEVEIVRYAQRAIIKYDRFRVEIRLATCSLRHTDG